jgi:hypothetical protein
MLVKERCTKVNGINTQVKEKGLESSFGQMAQSMRAIGPRAKLAAREG